MPLVVLLFGALATTLGFASHATKVKKYILLAMPIRDILLTQPIGGKITYYFRAKDINVIKSANGKHWVIQFPTLGIFRIIDGQERLVEIYQIPSQNIPEEIKQAYEIREALYKTKITVGSDRIIVTIPKAKVPIY